MTDLHIDEKELVINFNIIQNQSLRQEKEKSNTESVVKATDLLTRKLRVSPQVNCQNICPQSMSKVSEIYRNSCAESMTVFALN